MPSISVFTPTHSPRHLADAYGSLVLQTEPDWEWVVVPNGGGSVPDAIRDDPRVRVFPFGGGMPPGIGALKRFAAARATAPVVAELDHDDILGRDCLASVLGAVAGGAEFVYSDFVRFGDAVAPYDPARGWRGVPFRFRDRKAVLEAAFEPCPSSLRRIEYAPNHVRAWTRGLYDRAGGHDPAMAIGDDHDLVCRSYLAGGRFARLAGPHYFYREHDANTWDKDPGLPAVRDMLEERYGEPLALEWSRRHGLLALDLGAYHNKKPGYLGVDLRRGPSVDLACDLRRGLPVAENSVGVVRAADFMEHFAPGREVPALWNALYRALAPGGLFLGMTPADSGAGAAMDPTHLSRWNTKSFWYVTYESSRKYVAGLDARFHPVRVRETYPSAWHRDQGIPYVESILAANKGQRHAGVAGS